MKIFVDVNELQGEDLVRDGMGNLASMSIHALLSPSVIEFRPPGWEGRTLEWLPEISSGHWHIESCGNLGYYF